MFYVHSVQWRIHTDHDTETTHPGLPATVLIRTDTNSLLSKQTETSSNYPLNKLNQITYHYIRLNYICSHDIQERINSLNKKYAPKIMMAQCIEWSTR